MQIDEERAEAEEEENGEGEGGGWEEEDEGQVVDEGKAVNEAKEKVEGRTVHGSAKRRRRLPQEPAIQMVSAHTSHRHSHCDSLHAHRAHRGPLHLHGPRFSPTAAPLLPLPRCWSDARRSCSSEWWNIRRALGLRPAVKQLQSRGARRRRTERRERQRTGEARKRTEGPPPPAPSAPPRPLPSRSAASGLRKSIRRATQRRRAEVGRWSHWIRR